MELTQIIQKAHLISLAGLTLIVFAILYFSQWLSLLKIRNLTLPGILLNFALAALLSYVFLEGYLGSQVTSWVFNSLQKPEGIGPAIALGKPSAVQISASVIPLVLLLLLVFYRLILHHSFHNVSPKNKNRQQ